MGNARDETKEIELVSKAERRAENLQLLEDALDITTTTVHEHYIKMPSELSYFNELYAKTVRRFLQMKVKYEQARAASYLNIRQEHEEAGQKITEAKLSNLVETDEEVMQLRLSLAEAEASKQEAKGRCEALHAKKEMLISLGAHLRAEMSDPTLTLRN